MLTGASMHKSILVKKKNQQPPPSSQTCCIILDLSQLECKMAPWGFQPQGA